METTANPLGFEIILLCHQQTLLGLTESQKQMKKYKKNIYDGNLKHISDDVENMALPAALEITVFMCLIRVSRQNIQILQGNSIIF